jgi:hypothetical protein
MSGGLGVLHNVLLFSDAVGVDLSGVLGLTGRSIERWVTTPSGGHLTC